MIGVDKNGRRLVFHRSPSSKIRLLSIYRKSLAFPTNSNHLKIKYIHKVKQALRTINTGNQFETPSSYTLIQKVLYTK